MVLTLPDFRRTLLLSHMPKMIMVEKYSQIFCASP